MEGRQHHTGVTTTDSKLAFGSASEGCVHEVTGLKPARWAVTERLAKQFPHAPSSAGFLTLFARLLRPVTFSVFPKVLMILETRNVSTRVLSKASQGSGVHAGCLVASEQA